MRKTLTLLLASTALTTAVALPAWSAMRRLETPDASPVAAAVDAGPDAPAVMLASNDDDDRGRSGRSDDDDEEDDDDEDDDDDDRGGAARKPAPAGAVAPPANGLFGTGAPPKVQVN